VLQGISSALTSILDPMVVLKDLVQSYLKVLKTHSPPSVCLFRNTCPLPPLLHFRYLIAFDSIGMFNGFDWYGRTIEVREVRPRMKLLNYVLTLFEIGSLRRSRRRRRVRFPWRFPRRFPRWWIHTSWQFPRRVPRTRRIWRTWRVRRWSRRWKTILQ
jgi:hypothetical protein